MGIMPVYCIDGMLFDYVDEAHLGKISSRSERIAWGLKSISATLYAHV